MRLFKKVFTNQHDSDVGQNYRFEVIELSDSDVADHEPDFSGLDSATVDQSISMDHLRT